ncbi:copia protein [Tanacetum coccineum]
MSVKYPNYVNLTSSSEEQPNERTPSPPPRMKSLSPPQSPLKSISINSTHYTSSSSPKEPIDSGFARFNTIITSLKALDEGFSSKNYVRKFFRALHPKWRAKVTAIEESKDLSSLALGELIGNLKVHKVVMEKDSVIYRGKKERINSIALKAKKESSDDETSTSGSDDEEYAMAVRNFKKFFRRNGKFVRQPREEKKSFRQRDERKGKSDLKCFRCGDPNHLIGDCPKPSRNKDQKAFIGGSWRDRENDTEEKTNDETCLMAQSSNKVTLNSSYYSDNTSSLDNDSMQIEYDSLCEISLKIINKNKILKTKRDLLEKENLELNEKIKKLERSKEIEIVCKSCEELKLENARLKETQVKFVKFDKSANSLREMLDNQKSSSCKYIKEMLKKFRLEDYKPTKTPMSTKIKLTKDDEANSVDSSKYRENPKTTHLETVKHIFRYIKGTTHLGLWYPKGTGIETIVYVDSDHAVDYVDCKSTSGVCTFMGCFLTSRFAKKQTALAISTTEAKYVSGKLACQQVLWMKQALIDYGICLNDVPIMYYNKGAIDLSKNPVQPSRTKHIEINHHFLCDNVQKGNISIEKVASEDNIADIFTKPLKREVLNYLRLGLGMMELIMDSDSLPSQK